MKQVLVISVFIFLLVGCAGPYAHRDQIEIGMTKTEITDVSRANPVYSCQRLYENNEGAAYIFYLLDEHNNLRPYKCRFSHNGVLNSIVLDLAYEDFALANARNIINGQKDGDCAEKMYWEKY